MKINEVISFVENLINTQSGEEHVYAPPVRCSTVGSTEYPKIEVQVGPVLFSANNEEVAVYLPDLNVDSFSPENSLHIKVPLDHADPSDIQRMVANTYGLGVTLDNMRKNNLQPIGLSDDKLFAHKEGKSYAYDYRNDFQLPGQTLLRVWEMEQTPECKWDKVPSIYCQPRLVEVMSSQLDIAARATINAPTVCQAEPSPTRELEKSTLLRLQTIFPTAKSIVRVAEEQNEMTFSLSVQDQEISIEERGEINEMGELTESTQAKGPRQKIADYQQQVLPVWEELSQAMVALHEQRQPSIDV